METKYIYLIRHGQTDYNKKGIVQGSRVDTDLNDEGREQAARFYDFYKHIKFDKIYTSLLKRTHQSVEKFIKSGIAQESYQGLNEISWGEQDGKVSNTEMHDYYMHVTNQWASGNLDLQIGGGESPNEVSARQQPIIEMILSRKNEKNILICMHGRAMRVLLCKLTNQPISKMDTFGHSNLCLYVLKFDGKNFNIENNNNTEHLK